MYTRYICDGSLPENCAENRPRAHVSLALKVAVVNRLV